MDVAESPSLEAFQNMTGQGLKRLLFTTKCGDDVSRSIPTWFVLGFFPQQLGINSKDSILSDAAKKY